VNDRERMTVMGRGDGHVTHNRALGKRKVSYIVWGLLDSDPSRLVALRLDEDSAARLAWNLVVRFAVEPRHAIVAHTGLPRLMRPGE